MLIVTIAALVMAASLGWFAYRLMQEEQRRSEARVALLASALDAAPASPPATWSPREAAARPLDLEPTPTRVTIAPHADVAPWHGGDRHNGVPQVVMLDDDARDIRRFASEGPARPATAPLAAVTPDAEVLRPNRLGRETPAPIDPPLHRSPVASLTTDDGPEVDARRAGLFAEVPTARPGDGRGVIAVVALLLVGVIAAGYLWFGRSATPTAAAASTTQTGASAPAAGGVPLDLLSLAHERRGDTLVVRGVVRNPVAGSARPGLVASVLLLDQSGGFLRSGRAALPTAALAPGAESAFAVELPSTSDVRRYRVTFRGADGALVPHADKR